MHSHRANFEARAGNFAIEMQRDAFIGLKTKRQGVRIKVAAIGREQDVWCRPELNSNFAGACGKIFAGAQKEWDTGPAPIVDEELKGNVGFDIGIGLDLGFLAIAGALLAIDRSGEVLATD